MTADGRGTEAETAEVPATTSRLLTPRGETLIAPEVVEKIASKAATEVEGVGGVLRTGLGRLLPWVSDDTPTQAAADVDRETVAVDLAVNVRYPEPVAEVTSRVRDHVVQRLSALTGLAVTEVNITVDELVVERGPLRRRVE